MRFYESAHDILYKMSKKEKSEQYLFLVPEVNNKHDEFAVMLHDGHQKLGSVSSTECYQIRKLLEKWKMENNAGTAGEDVIVCYIGPSDYTRIDSFSNYKSIKVFGFKRVNERLARKYAAYIKNEEK